VKILLQICLDQNKWFKKDLRKIVLTPPEIVTETAATEGPITEQKEKTANENTYIKYNNNVNSLIQ
jgi:hypothetical protein